MADKKITAFDPAGPLTVNDIFALCQDPVTGILLQSDLGTLRTFVFGGANAGARVYFNSGVPSALQGVDGDVAFDKTAKNIYSKIAGAWVLQDSYGAADGGAAKIRFTSVYGGDGLSADGLTFTDTDMIGGDVLSVRVDATELIPTEDPLDIPAFDEFGYDTDTGIITFGSPLPAGFRITIIYSL